MVGDMHMYMYMYNVHEHDEVMYIYITCTGSMVNVLLFVLSSESV